MALLSFSIIMANYNNGKYIKEAIESVFSQTYSKWELIIVDDCSTDNSLNIIEPFLRDERVRLIKFPKNKGVGYAKKKGCESAKNDILGILDADDKLAEDALQVIANSYNANPDIGFIYSNMWSCNSELKNCTINKKDRTVPEKQSIFKPIILHFRTFKREEYNKTLGYDPNLRSAVDKDIIYKLEEVTNFKFINQPLYFYRNHEKGISQSKNQFNARINHYRAMCKTYQRRIDKNLPNFQLQQLYKEYYKITFHNIIGTFRILLKKCGLQRLENKMRSFLRFI